MARYKVEFEYQDIPPGTEVPNVDTRICQRVLSTFPYETTAGTVKVTRLPDPPIRQRFMVEVESPGDWGAANADGIVASLLGPGHFKHRNVTVTEVKG